MSKKEKLDREIKKKLKQYLVKPSDELKGDLIKLNYLPELETVIPGIHPARLLSVIDLLKSDSSDPSLAVLKRISSDTSYSIPTRKTAIDAIEQRGASPDDAVKNLIGRLAKIAAEDDEAAAGKIVTEMNDREVDAWVEILVENKAAKSISAAGAATKDKKSLKALKRAAYQLRARGVEVADWEDKGQSILKPPEKPEPTANALIADGEGNRMIFAQFPKDGEVYIFITAIDENNGLNNTEGTYASRGGANSFMKNLLSKLEDQAFKIPIEYAAYALESGAAKTAEKGSMTPKAYLEVKSIIKNIASGYTPPDPKSSIPDTLSIADARESVSLLNMNMFKTWIPDNESITLCKMKIEQALTSSIVISEAQRLGQIDKAFEDAAKTFLTPENRKKYSERLKEAALFFAWRDELTNAKFALAAAEEIEKEDSVPYLVLEMFKKAFPKAYDYEDEVKPPPPEEKTSGGGIIIP